MKYSFHQDAENELIQAIEYYEECGDSLGHDFAVEVYSAIERIALHPKAWPIIDEDIRRSLVKRFPYGILYSEENREIFIVAVMHLHKNPIYWKYRI